MRAGLRQGAAELRAQQAGAAGDDRGAPGEIEQIEWGSSEGLLTWGYESYAGLLPATAGDLAIGPGPAAVRIPPGRYSGSCDVES